MNYINTDKQKEYQQQYFQKNKIKIYSQRNGWIITLNEYNEMLKQAKNKCSLCDKDNGNRKLFIDHNHNTGKVRGLLCNKCNSALGMFNDDAELLKKASDYVIKYQ